MRGGARGAPGAFSVWLSQSASIRRPAVSPSTRDVWATPRSSTSTKTTPARSCTSPITGSSPATGSPARSIGRLALRPHAAAHRAARALAAFDRVCQARTHELSSGRREPPRSTWRSSCPRPDRRRPRRGQPHRLGGPAGHDPLCHRRGGGVAPAAQGAGPRGPPAPPSKSRISISAPAAARTWRAPVRLASIAVRGWERFKGGSRLEFPCGAGRSPRSARSAIPWPPSTRQLSVLPAELPDAIDRLQEEAANIIGCNPRPCRPLAGFQAAALAATRPTPSPR